MVEMTSARHRGRAIRFGALAPVCLAAAMLATGCASSSAHEDAELLQLSELLPGRYDNQAQITADRRAGRPPHEALALTVVAADALQIGPHVFYIEETAGHIEPPGTPRLILAQHLASFEAVKGKIVTALYSFTDPQRWRDGATAPEVFSSLQPQDVKVMRGCGLTWTRETERFTATDRPSLCQTTSPLTGSLESMRVRVELTREEIDVIARATEVGAAQPAADTAPQGAGAAGGAKGAGASAEAPAIDSYTRFRRSGGF